MAKDLFARLYGFIDHRRHHILDPARRGLATRIDSRSSPGGLASRPSRFARPCPRRSLSHRPTRTRHVRVGNAEYRGAVAVAGHPAVDALLSPNYVSGL